MGYVFISYSRRQLYFAESIALHLEKAGLEVWFDLQQLHAGVEWSSTLSQGYENCDRLVLVVSQASLASKYVRDEWEAALRKGREVILAAMEEVEIPEELKGKPTFDFRETFDTAMAQLTAYLQGTGPARYDPIPRSAGFLPRLPYDIRIILLSYILSGFWSILTTWLAVRALNDFFGSRVGTYTALGGTIVGLLLISSLRNFRKRSPAITDEIMQQGVKSLLAIQFVIVLLSIGMIVFHWNKGLGLADLVYLAAILSTGFTVYVAYRPKSADWLRWFPAGSASQALRHQFHRPLLGELPPEKIEFLGRAVNYSLTFERADLPLAEFIVGYISGVGNHLTGVDEAEKHLFLITNRTSRATLEEFYRQHADNAIYLLGSSVDRVDTLTQAYKTQLIDIRVNDPNDLIVLGKSLGDLESWRRYAALEATPKSLEANEVPAGVKTYIGLGGLQSVVFLALAFSGGILGLIFILFSIAMYVIVAITSSRKLSFVPALILYLICPVFAIFYHFGLDSIEPAINTILNVNTMMGGRYWFPAKAPVAKDAIGLKVTRKARLIEIVWIIVCAIFLNWVFSFT
jgi:hypothetical protein